MADNLNVKTGRDRSRVNLEQDHEIRYWTRALKCSEEELRAAVHSVGPSVDRIRQHLTGLHA